jgi:NTE family protein
MRSFWIGIAFIFVALLTLNACAQKNQYDALQTKTIKELQPIESTNKKTLGIAFGGGGVRCFTHLGVIKADVVTGTSARSLAASLYASGMSFKEIEKAVLELDELDLADITFSGDGGVIQGKKLAEWIQKSTNNAKIEEAPIKLGIAVTDLSNSESLLITQGNMGEAAQTSATIPGAFVPVKSNGKLLVDGGVLSLVPVKFNRALGADVVIGVDIYCGKIRQPKERMMNILVNATRVQSCKISEYEVADADLLIRPEYEPESYGNFDSKEESIQAGYEATKAMLPEIKRKLEI